MEELLTLNALVALATLTVLETVLGIDNVVFLAILTGKLPEDQQPKTRKLGLGLAALGRIVLLFAISWIITLDKAVLFELPFTMPGSEAAHGAGPLGEDDSPGRSVSGETTADDSAETTGRGSTPITAKDIVLLIGGLFLLGKATWEIGHQLEPKHDTGGRKVYSSLATVLAQIVAIDLVFSLDSVLTAVGVVRPEDYAAYWVPLTIMISAVLLSIAVMIAFSGPIAQFVNRHPSVKMLALSFLILIGVVLIAEAFHAHVPRGYIYFAMAFSLVVEMLNLRARQANRPGHA